MKADCACKNLFIVKWALKDSNKRLADKVKGEVAL